MNFWWSILAGLNIIAILLIIALEARLLKKQTEIQELKAKLEGQEEASGDDNPTA